MKNTIHYMAGKHYRKLYFTNDLYKVTQEFSRTLHSRHRLYVFPDATHKTFGLPTGLAVTSPPESTRLYPYLLRDPGCGFLLFKLHLHKPLPQHWQQLTGKALHKLLNVTPYSAPIPLNQILNNGVLGLTPDAEQHLFEWANFNLDQSQLTFDTSEKEILSNDIGTLTNSIELKRAKKIEQTSAINDEDIIGFIHSGSLKFPGLLQRKFLLKCAEYCDINGLASIEEIRSGFFGVPIESELGYKYYQWLKAAMNFAIASRYLIFTRVKACIENILPVTIELIYDRCHAGIFNYQQSYHSMRGVQYVNPKQTHKPILIAGQRETPSILMRKLEHTHKMIPHGTGYHISNKYNYNSIQQHPRYQPYSDTAYCNSKPQPQLYKPYLTNLLTTVDHLEETRQAQALCTLLPEINVQSNFLLQGDQ